MQDDQLFTMSRMLEIGATLRNIGEGARSMEDAARRVIDCLYNQYSDPETGKSAFVLARLFKTHPIGGLGRPQQEFAKRLLGGTCSDQVPCFTLLATRGDHEDWNSRHCSRRHIAIPLPSGEFVESSPMLARVLEQLGIDPVHLGRPQDKLERFEINRNVGLFHVADAEGSPHILDQKDFVLRYGVRSVLGFGGSLPTGDRYCVILFSRVPILVGVVRPQCTDAKQVEGERNRLPILVKGRFLGLDLERSEAQHAAEIVNTVQPVLL
jgi:hypothetical protein